MERQLSHQQFLERLLEAADSGRARLLETYKRQWLTSSQFAILEAIADQQQHGCSQTELAASLKLAESTLSQQIEKLHQEGWLHRLRSKQDRRRSLLVLSQAGEQRLQAAQAAINAMLAEWLGRWTREQLEQMADQLDSLAAQQRHYLRWSSAATPASVQRDEWGSSEADPRLREAG